MKFNIDTQKSFVIIGRIRSFYVEQCDILGKYNKSILANFYMVCDCIYRIPGEKGGRKGY